MEVLSSVAHTAFQTILFFALSFQSIFRRRAKKAKRKKKNNYVSLAVTDTTAPQHNLAAAVEVETALTELNSNGTVVTKTTTSSAAKNGVKSNGSHNAKDTSKDRGNEEHFFYFYLPRSF